MRFLISKSCGPALDTEATIFSGSESQSLIWGLEFPMLALNPGAMSRQPDACGSRVSMMRLWI